MSRLYAARDVDELILLDVRATHQERLISPSLVKGFASLFEVPLTVGGGVRSISDIQVLLRAGADKVALGAVSITDPGFVGEAAGKFGSQAIVVSVDTFDSGASVRGNPSWSLDYCLELHTVQGAGEFLVQDASRDGTMRGLNLDLVRRACANTRVPVVIGGGAGGLQDIHEAFLLGASGVSLGALLQFTEQTPMGLHEGLFAMGVPLRTRLG